MENLDYHKNSGKSWKTRDQSSSERIRKMIFQDLSSYLYLKFSRCSIKLS